MAGVGVSVDGGAGAVTLLGGPVPPEARSPAGSCCPGDTHINVTRQKMPNKMLCYPSWETILCELQ